MTIDDRATRIGSKLESAAAATKCHGCGCFHDAVAALEASELSEQLGLPLRRSREALVERAYECQGCRVCWPAEALSVAGDLVEATSCAAAPVKRRAGWPPLPGDYRVARFRGAVAVCALHDVRLMEELGDLAPDGLSMVGTLHTENLGIERIIENVVANPNIRVLLVCGHDTEGRVGHLPGQSLIALVDNGLDERSRIMGAAGKRPRIVNVGRTLVEHFRRQVSVVDRRGEVSAAVLGSLIEESGRLAPPPLSSAPDIVPTARIVAASGSDGLVLDPAGYVVVLLDRSRRKIVAEHYANDDVVRAVIEGDSAKDIMATLLREGAVTRLDHSAYLGRELTRAEAALHQGAAYVQDEAPGEPCECTGCCGPAGSAGCVSAGR